MPVTLERLPELPVIVVTYHGKVDLPVVQEMYARFAELMQDIDGTVYRITDARHIESSFDEFMKILNEMNRQFPGSVKDSRVKLIFVGNGPWVRFIRDAMQNERFGHISIPAFDTLEEAVECARIQLVMEERSHAAEQREN